MPFLGSAILSRMLVIPLLLCDKQTRGGRRYPLQGIWLVPCNCSIRAGPHGATFFLVGQSKSRDMEFPELPEFYPTSLSLLYAVSTSFFSPRRQFDRLSFEVDILSLPLLCSLLYFVLCRPIRSRHPGRRFQLVRGPCPRTVSTSALFASTLR